MSKKTHTYFSKYESPNIVIVPTALCNSSPSKKARFEEPPNIKTKETICSKISSSEHEIIMKQVEQTKVKKIVKIHENLSTETMPTSEKNTNQLPQIKQAQESDNMKMEKNISKETLSASGKPTHHDPKIVMKTAEKYQCKYNMKTEENVSNIVISSEKKPNEMPVPIRVQAEEPKGNSRVNIEHIKKDKMSSFEKNTNHEPKIVSKQTYESEDKSNVNIEETAYNKKVNSSWASNYMQSIGQIHKQTARITLNRLKTHKIQKVDELSKTNEGVKTMETVPSSPNESSKDKNKSMPHKSTQLPQKPRKCKKIKLEITVVFKEPSSSSSDTDSNDGNDEDEPSVHADMSFLEDINVDEIVKSLCENISSKKEEGPCKGNDKLEENNNMESNEVSKENKFRTDCMEEKLLIPSETIKIEQISSVSNYNKKDFCQSKDNIIQNDSQVVNIKAKDQCQTPNPPIKLVASKDDVNPSLKTKPNYAKEKPQKASLLIEHNRKIKPLTPNLVTNRDDDKRNTLTPMMVVTPEDAKENRPTLNLSVISEETKKRPMSPNLVIKAVSPNETPPSSASSVVTNSENVKSKPLASSTVLKPHDGKKRSPIPIKSEDVKVKPLTSCLIINKDEDKEKPINKTLVAKSAHAEQRPLNPRFSENVNEKSLSPKGSIKINYSKDEQLTPSPITKLDHAKEKPLTPSLPKTPCIAKPSDKNKEKPVTSSQVTKPNDIQEKSKSPRLNIKPEDAKQKLLIPSQPQTSSVTMKSVITKSKQNSLMNLDRILAGNIETRLFQYLNEKLTVISIIHKGKFSRIYHFMDAKKKNYAVKILNNQCDRFNLGINKENMLIQLQREIPRDNLQFVYIHNGFSMKGYWCFLMDFYPQNLHEALKEHKKPFHIDKVQHLARQLVTAVTILRNNNIVHSDIKPGHILLNSAKDTLKVCGFDGSYFINDVNIMPNIGTSSYRAPEVIIGHSAGYSIDVWATAVVMFEMATNTKLFPGSFNNDILYKQICTLGTLPYQMVQKSLYRDSHFLEGKFMRRMGFKGQKTLILDHFYKNNKLEEGIFQAYQTHWYKNRSRPQQEADMEKLELLHLLLQQMLVLNPACRLAIEFVYANPFIYEFFSSTNNML